MTIQCHCCMKPVEPHRSVTCSVCKNNFNIECVDVHASIARSINNTKSGLKWNCSNCQTVGNDIDSLKLTIINLQKNLDEMKNSINELHVPQSSPLMMENIIQEVTERQKCSCNIMIYGSLEDSSLNKEQSHAKDSVIINSIVSDIGANYPIIKFSRIGRFDNSKPLSRPLKVQLSSSDEVIQIIKNQKL